MTEVPARAKCVIIGAGIVGNCLAGHLARLGWTEIVLLDKGPLPNPGGSTGHASNFIFPTDHNKEMALLTLESQRQYEELGLNSTCGGIEVARDEARLEEFKRRMTSAKAWGIDARLLTPAEIKELVPFINADILLGGYYTPSVSVVDSLQTGTLMRDEAVAKGALQVFANTEVLDIEVTDGTVSAVVTDKGRIEAEHVAIACGVWSPRIAAMAGATIPLTPAVHQMADVGPIDMLAQTNMEVAYPIIRDMDTFCYERQSGRLDGGRLVRPPPDLPPPRRHPVERGVRTDGDRAAVHRRRLRPADGRGHRPDGDARRRRDQVRHQRPAVAHARCDARARRDDRGAQPVVGRRGVGQGRSRHRPAGGGVDDVRLPEAVRPALVGHLALLPVRAHRAPHLRPLRRALQQDLRHRAPARAVGEPARHAPQPVLRAGAGARRGVLRRPRLGATAVVRVEHRSGPPLPRAAANRVRTSGTPVGGRRSPTPSTSTCATTSAWST